MICAGSKYEELNSMQKLRYQRKINKTVWSSTSRLKISLEGARNEAAKLLINYMQNRRWGNGKQTKCPKCSGKS